MSNLNLPAMHPVALKNLLNGKASKTLAYATTVNAETHSDGRITYTIRHHGHAIAVIGDYSVSISNAGYASMTTAARLHRILQDNNIPYQVNVKQGMHVLSERLSDGKRKVVNDAFHDAWFIMRAGLWTLADS